LKTIQFTVNGVQCPITCPPAKTLLDVLREDLGLTASKECCGKGDIITCEGVGLTPNLDVIQESFVEEGATQCGYCTPGIIVSAKAFLNGINHIPTTDEIKTALGGNLCRCTGYTKIIKAVQSAADKNDSKKETITG
jgi:carbon-monoxide dehydrogenase small subunit